MNQMDDWAYIARTTIPTEQWPEVGTAICAIVDDPKHQNDVANEVGEWIRNGLTVERVPNDWVRKYFGTSEAYVPGNEKSPPMPKVEA